MEKFKEAKQHHEPVFGIFETSLPYKLGCLNKQVLFRAITCLFTIHVMQHSQLAVVPDVLMASAVIANVHGQDMLYTLLNSMRSCMQETMRIHSEMATGHGNLKPTHNTVLISCCCMQIIMLLCEMGIPDEGFEIKQAEYFRQIVTMTADADIALSSC